jgi:hypothetical protein
MTTDASVGRAYGDGALIVGLDLTLGELETLIFGSSLRADTPGALAGPRLSMLYAETVADGCGGRGSFSDLLTNWPAAEFIVHRALEIVSFAQNCRNK